MRCDRAHGKLSTLLRGALAHAQQAEAPSALFAYAGTVIFDFENQPPVLLGQRQADLRCLRMFADIGQAFARDEIKRLCVRGLHIK